MSDVGNMIEHLFKRHPELILPAIVATLAIYAIKALYTLHGSRSQRRKEFLELWKDDPSKRDNLWIEMAVRHAFGKSIPASVVKEIIRRPDCAKNLTDISIAWKYLKYENGSISWSKKRFNTARKRTVGIWILNASYFLSALVSLAIFALIVQGTAPPVAWVYVVSLTIFSFVSLDLSIDLSVANRAVPRTLGLA